MRQLFLQTFYHPECEMREMRGLPAYQRIALVLESKIAGREWEPGQKIPAESDLAAEYGVSVMTARQALSELASSGLLERRQGHGTFVAMAAGQSRAPKTVDLSASMTEATHATQAVPAQLMDADTVRGPKWVFDALGLSDEDTVMRVRRIRASPEGPLSFTVSYMPESLGSALTTDDLYEDSLVGRLEERQHMHFPHAIQTIQATVADPVGAGIGIVGGALIALSRRRDDRLEESAIGWLTRIERKALTAQDRALWRTPALATLERPVMSPLRKAGLFTLRGYLIVAAVMVIVKIVQTATGR